MEKPSAGADGSGIALPGLDAIFINLITRIELTRPMSREPVSHIKILAGLKL